MSKSSKKSSEPGEEKNQVNGITQQSISTGKTTRQIMSRHMKDENDVITEDDIKNLNINPDISDDPKYQLLQIANDPGRPKDEDKDPEIIIPWDIIRE